MSTTTGAASALLQYLPAIYSEHPFLGRFLLAFEKVLLGRDDGVPLPKDPAGRDYGGAFPGKGLEQIIASLAVLFEPEKVRDEFLPWLAGWTAFVLRADLPVAQQRAFVANIISLYRWRGTKKNLQDLLKIFTIGTPVIREATGEFQVGRHSTIGSDTWIGGAPPHYFHVIVSWPRTSPETLEREMIIARSLIELEKPAHTTYELERVFPSMRIGRHSTVGVDTLLGSPTLEEDERS